MIFRDILEWQKSMDLVQAVYRETENLPDTEKFGLLSQIRRSAVSIPSNIAQGYGRGGTVECIRSVDVATGSLRELQTQGEIAKRLGYLHSEQLETLADEVGKVLFSLRGSLKAKVDL